MSRLPDRLNPPAIVETLTRYECPKCGNNCQCGVPYVPKTVRAAEAIKAAPDKSNRVIAAETGLSEPTVRRARASCDAPDTVTGRDGKTYPAGMTPGHVNNFRRNLPTPRVADTPEMEAKDAAADGAITDIVQKFQQLPSSRQQDRCMRRLMAGYKR
jgi:hypothetical protein